MRYAKEVFTNLPQRVIGEGVWWWAVSTAGNRFFSPLDYDSSLFFDNELEARVYQANRGGVLWVWKSDGDGWRID